MTIFVALLRGINVGGNKKVPMAQLRDAMEKAGFKNVKTLLASGNVVFESTKAQTKTVQPLLEKTFGFSISTIIIDHETIKKVVASNPFQNIKVTPKTRLYVTFLKDKDESTLKIPYTSDDQSFTIIKKQDGMIFSVLDLEKSGTVDAMKILEQEFGKNITTRNYNTVEKIAKL